MRRAAETLSEVVIRSKAAAGLARQLGSRGSLHDALARATIMPDEEPPLPPASPAPRPPSRLRRTLNSLRSPFRSGSPFHIGSIKRSGSTKSFGSDGEIARDERTMRKRNKKQRDAASDASGSTDSSPSIDKKKKDIGGGFIRRMGSIGRKRADVGEASTPPQSPQTDTIESILDSPPTPPPDTVTPPPDMVTPPPDAEPPPTEIEASVSPIAVEHPVATRPFTKAAWKKRSSTPSMEKPVEEPSPESALKRRIAFVAQASACFSEDHDDGEEGEERGEVGSLEEAVALARVRLAVPSPSPAHSRDDDTEEEGYTDAMPAYGDLIESESKAGEEPAPVSVAARARQ